MNKNIPQIIHQIWSGINGPLPKHFKTLGDTWKRDYPDWKYEFWDNDRLNLFIDLNYPQYWDIYNKFPYNIQRWDVVRYLILDKIGGMYVDFDYESLVPLDIIPENKTCCFSLEPENHCHGLVKFLFSNALMISIPEHPFMKQIIETVFSEECLSISTGNKSRDVLTSTGPLMLVQQYESLSFEEKDEIYLIPAKYVTPFDMFQARLVLAGVDNEELDDCLSDAYAVHYFFGEWLKGE